MRAVVKLGGALFPRDLEASPIKSMAKTLSEFAGQEKNKLVIVVGGGANARAYIETARKLEADESTSDLLGIQITKANAQLMTVALESEGVSAPVASDVAMLSSLLRTSQVVVIGGLQPGQSTNAVAALASEITRTNILVNATDVEGVYTEDPKKNRQARLLKTISAAKLLEMALAGHVFAGSYELLDPIAIKTLQRSRIPTRIVSILDPENIIKAIDGKSVGTLVVYS